MKKQTLINLVKYHVEKNDEAFLAEVAEIARGLDAGGDSYTAQYLMELVSSASFYVPQTSYKNLRYLQKVEYSSKPLFLPDRIEEDIMGITKAINNDRGVYKFLFYGKPGSGKTESAYQIARILNRDILSVDFERLIDSHLGETSKNIAMLFEEINCLIPQKSIIVFDEIDAIVLDRVNKNDLREMGRVTSTFLREMDGLKSKVPVIATTNLIDQFDKALLRRFDTIVSFDRYTREDLIQIADLILSGNLKKVSTLRQDMRLFHKILKNLGEIPYPGDLEPIIRTAIAFSDETNQYDYLRKMYQAFYNTDATADIQQLSRQGYTTREIEILTKIPKSSVSRKINRERSKAPAVF